MFTQFIVKFKDLLKNSDVKKVAIIKKVREQKLTYCGKPKLENLADMLLEIEKKNVKGAIVEAGVALGGSAIVLASLKSKNRPIHLYDVFGLIPAPGAEDDVDSHERYQVISSGQSQGLKGDTYYGYQEDLDDKVKKNFLSNEIDIIENKVFFHKGEFKTSMKIDFPVALAHIDCDWYDSILTCLEQIEPHLQKGGILVFDDYSSYKGAEKIINERIKSSPNYIQVFHDRSIGFKRV